MLCEENTGQQPVRCSAVRISIQDLFLKCAWFVHTNIFIIAYKYYNDTGIYPSGEQVTRHRMLPWDSTRESSPVRMLQKLAGATRMCG